MIKVTHKVFPLHLYRAQKSRKMFTGLSEAPGEVPSVPKAVPTPPSATPTDTPKKKKEKKKKKPTRQPGDWLTPVLFSELVI